MLFENGSIALVTGAARGIGAEISISLAQKGVDLILHYNSSGENARELCKMLSAEYGIKTYILKLDLSDTQNLIESLNAEISNKIGKINLLVNNAGMTDDGAFALLKKDNWKRMLELNLTSPLLISQWFVNQHPRKKTAAIVNISSVAAQMGNIGQVNYSTTKAGILGMTKSLAKEAARKKIRVNAVAAGLIDSDMTKDLPGADDMKKLIALGRFGEKQEVASAVSFLLSNDASYITGQTLSVNGGMLCP